MSKVARQNMILQLIESGEMPNQEVLRKALAHKGYKVTQTTLSRDIHELGLAKGPEGYQEPPSAAGSHSAEPMLPPAKRLVREFVLEVTDAQNLVLVKTAVGSAGPVAAALDDEGWPEVLGTIAGDDTILIVTKNNKAAHRLALRVRELLA